MTAAERQRIAEMEAAVRDLRQRTANIPCRWQQYAAEELTVSVVGTNTLSSGGLGTKRISTTLALGATYDPQVVTSTPDGLGVGLLYRDGVPVLLPGGSAQQRVLFALDSRSPVPYALADGDFVTVAGQVVYATVSGTQYSCYLARFFP